MTIGPSNRFTIGVLLDSHLYSGMYPSMFATAVIRGIQSAARDQGVNLLIACGMLHGTGPSRLRPAWPDPDEGTDFIPVGPWNTDGLLVFSPLRSENRIRYVSDLLKSKFPLLFIGSGAGSPAITVDNEGGIRQVLEHLVGHGHRNIAFIAGDPEDPGDSRARIRAYREGVRAFGLNDDPRLMEVGQHWDEAACQAVGRMLKSGVKFTAVMCSNDQSALGAMRALEDAGLRIPRDVAVTGFNDQPEAISLNPPLTSVHYPLFETGYRALLLVRKQIEEGTGSIPDTVRVSTQLMPRQSCGCLPQIHNPVNAVYEATVSADREDPQRYREDLAQAMGEALLIQNGAERITETRPLCERLVSAFLQSVQDEDLSHFQVALMEILQRIEWREEDAHAWQAAISVLRLCTRAPLAGLDSAPSRRLAEDLLHQARTLLSDSARRRFTRLRLTQAYQDEAMGVLTARLLSSLDEAQIYGALADNLPQVGIRSAQAVFFEPRGDDPYAESVLPAGGARFPGLRFETRRFPPVELAAGSEPFQYAILPLFFQEENLGYMAFDGENLDPLAMIVIQLAAAIKNAQLRAKVRGLSLTDGLTEVNNRRYFEILLANEADRSRRYDRDLAVVIADPDRFKEYNDAFGHPAGDEALWGIARCLRAEARRGLDVVARYGGEAFILILPETDGEGARTVAEKIRRRIGGDSRFLRRLTVSIGIAALRGNAADPATLVDQADRALHQAKGGGRDRCVRFEDWMRESTHAIRPVDGPTQRSARNPGKLPY
jgi:diguanylate cyclase (GGDEF)-like protein